MQSAMDPIRGRTLPHITPETQCRQWPVQKSWKWKWLCLSISRRHQTSPGPLVFFSGHLITSFQHFILVFCPKMMGTMRSIGFLDRFCLKMSNNYDNMSECAYGAETIDFTPKIMDFEAQRFILQNHQIWQNKKCLLCWCGKLLFLFVASAPNIDGARAFLRLKFWLRNELRLGYMCRQHSANTM